MTSKAAGSQSQAQIARKARLAEELRANLQRRKAQARSRRTGGPDERPDGLPEGLSAVGEAGPDDEAGKA